MRSRVPRRSVLFVVGACVLSSLVMVGAGLGSNPDTLSDPAGDAAGGGADITNVVVSNDASGNISIRVETPNHAAIATTENIQLFIDLDSSGSTGTNGYERRLRVFGGSQPPIAIETWTGNWVPLAAPSFKGTFDGGLTATISKTDLGVTDSFSYAVITIDGKTGDISDLAPNGALSERHKYTLSNPVVDSDKDGIVDTKDACRQVAAGKYDVNRNGCPGPFRSIRPRVAFTYEAKNKTTRFTMLAVKGVPVGSTVTLAGAGLKEIIRATSGTALSRKMLGQAFLSGRTLDVKVTKPGLIGYVRRFRIAPSGGLAAGGAALCIRAQGATSPVACASVDRGK